jgi:flagellar hook-associated protein 3 FlgL
MIRFLNPADERFLSAINSLGQRAARAQREVSSGKRILDASDAPDQVSQLLAARSSLSRAEQIRSNLDRVRTEVDSAEQAVANSVRIVERARVLAATAVNGTQTPNSRAIMAGEVDALLRQLATQANSNVIGRYLFAGDADYLAPFAVDLGPLVAVSAYAGTVTTRKILHPTGDAFPASMSGDEIFTNADPTRNAFAVITSLRDALVANDEARITTELANLGSVGEHLNQMLAFYGTAQNQIEEATTSAESSILQFKTQIMRTEEVDLASAILEMNRLATQQNAALESRARLPSRTLFDYLG